MNRDGKQRRRWRTSLGNEHVLWMSKNGQATCPAKLVRQVGQSASLDLQEVLEIFASGQIMQQTQQFQIFNFNETSRTSTPKAWVDSPVQKGQLPRLHGYPSIPHEAPQNAHKIHVHRLMCNSNSCKHVNRNIADMQETDIGVILYAQISYVVSYIHI